MRVAWRRGVVSRSAVVLSLFTYQHMKLHLPSRLRKALLACLAALAARRRVPHTVSTGTALLGVFTMLWSTASRAAAQQQNALPSEEEVRLLDEQDGLVCAREGDERAGEADLFREISAANAVASDSALPIASSDDPYAIAPITTLAMTSSQTTDSRHAERGTHRIIPAAS